jgi:hypothetical protein
MEFFEIISDLLRHQISAPNQLTPKRLSAHNRFQNGGGFMKKFLVSSLLLVSSSLALANSQNFSVSPVSDKSLAGKQLLRLKIQDVQPKSGVCPYYVKQTQYLPALQVLSVEVYQENCVNDAYGISKGEVDWVVPATLLATGREVQVLVNQTKTSILVYDETTQSFRVKN